MVERAREPGRHADEDIRADTQRVAAPAVALDTVTCTTTVINTSGRGITIESFGALALVHRPPVHLDRSRQATATRGSSFCTTQVEDAYILKFQITSPMLDWIYSLVVGRHSALILQVGMCLQSPTTESQTRAGPGWQREGPAPHWRAPGEHQAQEVLPDTMKITTRFSIMISFTV